MGQTDDRQTTDDGRSDRNRRLSHCRCASLINKQNGVDPDNFCKSDKMDIFVGVYGVSVEALQDS